MLDGRMDSDPDDNSYLSVIQIPHILPYIQSCFCDSLNRFKFTSSDTYPVKTSHDIHFSSLAIESHISQSCTGLGSSISSSLNNGRFLLSSSPSSPPSSHFFIYLHTIIFHLLFLLTWSLIPELCPRLEILEGRSYILAD